LIISGKGDISADVGPKDKRKWEVMFLLVKVKALGKLDRGMSIAAVGCSVRK
jgi:hypothetical protein